MRRTQRRRTLTLITLVAVGLLTLAVSGAPAFAQPAAPGLALSGELQIIWGDPDPASSAAPVTTYYLIDDQGQQIALAIDPQQVDLPAGGLISLYRKRVTIQGVATANAASGRQEVSVATIERAKPNQPDPSADPVAAPAEAGLETGAVTGSQPWVTILCRFGDSTDVTPQPKSYFDGLMGGSAPQLNHYWRALSYNTININGSLVVGWYNLPQPRSYYVTDNGANLSNLLSDCAAAADANVLFPGFKGINLVFNQNLDCCAWGGSGYLNLDGVDRSYPVTWLPPWGWGNQSVLGHEMGHAFGLPHSSGPYGETYDSQWDVMSNAWRCTPVDPTYGCVGPHTLAYHKNLLGWIPAAARYQAVTAGTHNLALSRLAAAAPAGSYLLAEVPLPCSSLYYTVEARRFLGYDTNLPGEAVIINQIDQNRANHANIVDPDNNSDPNDAGAMWLPGETFTDASNAISIAVGSATASGWNISVNTPGSTGAFEPNNSAAEARPFTVGETKTLDFCVNGDEDWFSFAATAGTTYTIETLNLDTDPYTDTVLDLYSSNLGLIASNDDTNGLASLIVHTPSSAGTLYVRARQFGGFATGSYDLRITATAPPSANLLRNPSFELDSNSDTRPDSWSTNSRFTRSSAVTALDGRYVGRFRATDNTGTTISQLVNVRAGTAYTFACSLRMPATSDSFTFRFQIQWRNSSNTTISTWTVKTYSDDTANAWNEAQGSRAAPSGAVKAQVRLIVTSLNGTIYIDRCGLR